MQGKQHTGIFCIVTVTKNYERPFTRRSSTSSLAESLAQLQARALKLTIKFTSFHS